MQTVLILDDDPGIRKTLTHSLQAHQFKVTCAETADEASAYLKKNAYDLVLVDFAMPEHDGKWFMQNAKIPKKTKVLLITGYISRDLINTMFSLGVCGYLIKPIDEETLLHNIHFYLGTPMIHEFDNRAAAHEPEQNVAPAAPMP